MNDTGRTVLIVIVVLVALPLLWGGMMMGGMGSGMMWGWQGTDRWDVGRGFLMMVPAVLIIVGIVAAITWGLGRAPSSSGSSGGATAREVLDARYARGEITRDQYQQMKSDLDS